ncbi:MAG: RibD family protein, partial [Pseudomonadota bacterium]|nr:RibD family protein [Pseudomonadota bacterium]
QPLRVIMDTALSIPPEAKILYPTNEVLVFCDEEEIEADHLKTLQKKKVDVRFLPLADDGRLDLVEAMGQLADDGINEVLVETGAVLAGAFLDSGLVDELVVYMAPKLLGSEARPLLSLPLVHMSDAVELILLDMTNVGNDIMLVYQPIYREEEDA